MSKEDQAAYGGDDEGSKPTTPTMTPDKSFINSDGHEVEGIKLFPYTPERMWAADAMGLRYGNLSKAASLQYMNKGTYPGMEADVAIVMWLCSLKDKEEIRAARRNPDTAEDLAIEYCRSHKMVSIKQAKWWKAYDVFLEIMREVHAAYGEPKKKQEQTATAA